MNYLRRTASGGVGCSMGITTKYLRGDAGIGLATAVNYSVTKYLARRRGHRPGHHG